MEWVIAWIIGDAYRVFCARTRVTAEYTRITSLVNYWPVYMIRRDT